MSKYKQSNIKNYKKKKRRDVCFNVVTVTVFLIAF